MRCRKVRSFLSAYSRDELDGRKKLRVSEHLLTCAHCRKEEAVYRQLNETVAEIPEFKPSEDFNAKLLGRIANERFAETRTKAYMPKKAPAFSWAKLAPVMVSACLALFLVISYVPFGAGPSPEMANDGSGLDDSYLTVSPDSNPNMTVQLHKDWSLNEQLAWNQKLDRISNSITPATSRTSWNSRGVLTSGGIRQDATPYYRVNPVLKVKVTPLTNSKREDALTY